jgi:hypothetical protein
VERICNAKGVRYARNRAAARSEPEDYEWFFAEELAPTLKLPGWKTHLLRGDRGARSGKYLVLHEGESLDARDRYFPGPGEQSEGFTRFLEQHPETAAAMEKWERSQSTRKTTLRPITSPSLNSAFYSYPGTRDTAGRPALPATTGGTPHPAPRAGRPHLVEHSNCPLVGLMLPIRAAPAGCASGTSSGCFVPC